MESSNFRKLTIPKKVDVQSPEIFALLKAAPIYTKNATVSAEKVTSPKAVTTILSSGYVETANIVQVGEWVVTNPDGEQYILSDSKFHQRYAPTELESVWKARGSIRAVKNPYNQEIEILAPWGTPQLGEKDCWIAVSLDDDGQMVEADRYIIESNAFAHTYAKDNSF